MDVQLGSARNRAQTKEVEVEEMVEVAVAHIFMTVAPVLSRFKYIISPVIDCYRGENCCFFGEGSEELLPTRVPYF